MKDDTSEIKNIGSIPSDTYIKRHFKLFNIMRDEKIDILALNPGPTLFYLTGLEFHLSERPILCLIIPQSNPIFVLPELETGKLEDLPFPVQVHEYGEDPAVWDKTFNEAIRAAGLDGKTIGFEPRRMRLLESGYINKSDTKFQIINAEECISELRMIKELIEINAVRNAVNIAQSAFLNTIPKIQENVSERFMASELTLQLLRLQSDPEFPFTPIVQSGPNSAVPHLHPTERRFNPGEPIVIDWGARFQGYISDLTRTFFIGKPNDEMEKVFQIVLAANFAAKSAARPDVPAGKVDEAARTVIEEAGYGKFFIHRTGHGIGLEGHESPYIRSGNDKLLKPGMTFTIEPGIYIPGLGGVRIEDDILITETGIESLSNLPYEF